MKSKNQKIKKSNKKDKNCFIDLLFYCSREQSGFTLFETVIYVAIAGVILVSFVQFSLTVSGSRNKNFAVQEVQANARTALDLITQKIRLADDVVSPAEGTSGGTLILDMPAPDPSITISLNGNYLNFNDGLSVNVTSEKVKVTSINFTNLAKSGERDNIAINFVVEYNTANDVRFSHTETIQTAVGLRK